jgi:hypothetical protein
MIATALLLTGAGTLAEDFSDPMRPPAGGTLRGPSVALAPTRVTGLFISATQRAAIVDGQLVSAGQRAGPCLVLEVLDHGVRCRFPKSIRVVLLPNRAAAVKTPTVAALAANGVLQK